jgi:hypothetical protein
MLYKLNTYLISSDELWLGHSEISILQEELQYHVNAYLVCSADEVKIMSIKKLANYICTKRE